MIEKIVSGGQTGADRAGLDVALILGIPLGGWCPKGRRAEDGPIADRYPMRETRSGEYEERTRLNVRDSDATVVFIVREMGVGSAHTVETARGLGRPLLVVDLSENPGPQILMKWIGENSVRVLNVAGSRENRDNPIYEKVREYLLKAFSAQASAGQTYGST